MATKKFRPVTPSLRNTTVSDFAEITKKTPETLEVFPKETFTSLMVVSPKFQES